MQSWIIEVMNQFGYVGIIFLIAVENIFPPIPSEVILTFGGFMTTYTDLKVWGVIAAATAGSILGAVVLYESEDFCHRNDLGYCLTVKPEKSCI